MGTNECSQPASKFSWDSQDFGDISMVLKMAHFRKSTGPRWVNSMIPLSLLTKGAKTITKIVQMVENSDHTFTSFGVLHLHTAEIQN